MNADKILEILSKASTWKGIVGVATAFGIVLSPDMSNYIISVGVGIVGMINLIRTEKKQ